MNEKQNKYYLKELVILPQNYQKFIQLIMAFKLKFFAFICMTCLFFIACLQTKSTKNNFVELEIYNVLNYQSQAWNRGDLKGFMEGYEKSDSLQFITRKGRTLGWQNVLDNYSKHYPTQKEMGHLRFKNIIIKSLSDSLAQAYGNWELMKDSAVGGNFSLIMKNKTDGWKIIIDHTW